jgi:threonyl-tRNA synthetase
VVGEREVETASVSVRAKGGVDLGVKTLDEFIAFIINDVKQLGRINKPEE